MNILLNGHNPFIQAVYQSVLSLVKPSITLATGVFCCAIHAYVYDLRFDNHDDNNPDDHDDVNPDNHDHVQGGELVCAWLCDGHLRSFGRPRACLELAGITLQ